MAAELQAHLELQEAAYRAAGLSSQEAHYAARRQFGHLDGIKETVRDRRGWVWLEALLKDFRFGVRSLAKSPGFTLAVVATLAIGIGATTAIVSYARPIVFPRIPYEQPERMVVVTCSEAPGSQVEAPYPFFYFSYRFAFIRDAATSFAALGASRFDQMNLVVHGDPASAYIGWATRDYLTLFGAMAEHGRLFLPEEYRGNSGDVVLLSWPIWQKRFGGDPGIVGRDIFLGGRNRRVVGVLSMQFSPSNQFGPADVYLPDEPSPTPNWSIQVVQVVGQLKPGITIAQAQAEMDLFHPPVLPGMDAAFPDKIKPRIIPLTAYYQTARSYIYWVFLGAVGFLYAIACSNAVSLMLARTVVRRRELGVRLAMGGSWWQVIRLLLAESIVLNALAGLVGIVVAHWGYWALVARQPPQAPAHAVQVLALNLPTLATVAAVSLISSILIALVPALRIKHTRLSDSLKEGAGSLGDSRPLQRLRNGLVITQAALAVTLLAGAGLTLQSFWRLERVDLGFDPENKLAVTGFLPDNISPEAFLRLSTRFRDDIARIPMVVDVTCSGYLPMAGMAFPPTEARIVGRPELGEIQLIGNGVSPEYFPTLGVPILAGRGFAGMHPGDPPVAIISENAARRYFGSANPLGQHLDMDKNGKWEIVGVVGDVRDWGRRQGTKPQFYYPFWQPPTFTSSLFELVRLANTPPPGLEAMIRRAAYAADSHLIVNVQHLADNARQDVQNERNAMLIMEVMSALALVLAATGLFAVMAYGVAQRQREFGVRMALGAAPRDLQRLVLRRGLLLAAAGVVIGLGAAWSLTRFLQSVLYETSVHDPITYTGVAVALLGVALLACWLPAKRAARADPMEVLRAE